MKNLVSWGKERMLLYAAKDALCTGLVRRGQEPLMSPQQHRIMQEILLPASLALNHMERRGVKVDVNTLAIMYANVIPQIEALQEEIQHVLGINASSPKQVSSYFGIKSSDREALSALISRGHEQREIIEKILEYRDLSKGASTFLRGVYKRLEDGCIHTEYNPSGTGTGRLSSTNPNLQNVQKKFRAIYVPDEPDQVFLAGDFKQLELWVVGYLSPGDTLLTALKGGLDIHDRMQKNIWDYIPERLKWNARVVVKTVVFGPIYGRGARSIAIQFGVAVSTAEYWLSTLFDDYPELRAYQEERIIDFRQRGYVDTPFGRRRFIQSPTQAMNAPVQSTANDVKLKALIRLDQAGFDLRLDVHDEIVCVVEKKELKKKAGEMREIMEAPIEELGGMKFRVDIEWGNNWCEMKRILV